MDNINMNDIKSVMSIIEVCTQRGAFKSEELENVGRLYNKFKLFINKSIEPPAMLPKTPDQPHKENLSSDENGGHGMRFKEVKTI